MKKIEIGREQLIALLNAARVNGKTLAWVAEQLSVTRQTIENRIVEFKLRKEWR